VRTEWTPGFPKNKFGGDMAVTEFYMLDELKARAKANGYTKIRRISHDAPTVSIEKWTGVSDATVYQTAVWYLLDGNKVRVLSSEEDLDYELS
jgi:hypothetical protein